MYRFDEVSPLPLLLRQFGGAGEGNAFGGGGGGEDGICAERRCWLLLDMARVIESGGEELPYLGR